jgi:glutamate carboxypeptidase
MHAFIRYAIEKQPDIVAFIREMVEVESPSDNPEAIDSLLTLITERTCDIAKARRIEANGAGAHLRLEFDVAPETAAGQLLALGHSDTVWPLGTLRRMPFKEEDGRLWGPGVLDMKAGIAFFIFAMRALRDLRRMPSRRVVLLLVSDEEVGSETSRELTIKEAKQSDAVLVLEPGTGLTGKLKTARKGVGDYTIRVEGRAAHAGVDFSAGANAIVEIARQVQSAAGWTDLERGLTVNPGVIRGGTRTNVVPAEAEVDIDIRVRTMSDAEELDTKFKSLVPFDERCRLQVRGGLNRPPMEPTPAIAKLFGVAKSIGNEIGITVEESATGGGSDGNFTAAAGVPTLDGIGAVGEGAHALNESILVDRIADRVALLAGLVERLSLD